MAISQFRRAVIGLVVALPLAAGMQLTATAAPVESAPARTLYFDTSQAGQYGKAWEDAAAVWNQNLKNVKLVKGTSANSSIRIRYDSGWPRAQPGALGSGTVWLGQQTIDQGYYVPRIATHELGHILGLPDRKPGPCSSLMSGSTGGVSCKSVPPSPAEAAEVDRKFAGSRTAAAEAADGNASSWPTRVPAGGPGARPGSARARLLAAWRALRPRNLTLCAHNATTVSPARS